MTPEIEALHEAYHHLADAMNELTDATETEREDFPLTDWQEYASPVWMTVRRTNVLNVALGREDKDERHMCPLQLDIIERAVKLWSNPGDVVFSPFLGVGSEGVGSLKLKRKFIGTELKASYFAQAVKFLTEEERDIQTSLFPR